MDDQLSVRVRELVELAGKLWLCRLDFIEATLGTDDRSRKPDEPSGFSAKRGGAPAVSRRPDSGDHQTGQHQERQDSNPKSFPPLCHQFPSVLEKMGELSPLRRVSQF
jgi:hypothetical protein